MSETTQDLLAKAYEMQRTDAALAMVRERDYWERRALQAEAQLLTATPPTPDRAAVREALVLMLSATPYRLLDPLADALGHKGTFPERVADALLGPAPLPADVQAAVERAEVIARAVQSRRLERFGGMGHEPPLVGDVVAETLRTLLAHLTREAR